MCTTSGSKLLKRNTVFKLFKDPLINFRRNSPGSLVETPLLVVPIKNYSTQYFKKILLFKYPNLCKRRFYSTIIVEEDLVDSNTFEKVCEKTLDSLAEYFEELVASESKLEKGDIIYGAGVLTVDLGTYGTYVINRQSPNRQIWLSSPTSGPKRYDYSIKENSWIYKHDGKTLHSLLENEISSILKKNVKISKCS